MKYITRGIIVILTIMTIVVLGYFVYMTVSQDMEAKRQAEALREKHLDSYGTTLMAMCQSPNFDVTGKIPIFEETMPRLLVLQTGSDQAHVWHESLPAENYPADAAEVDLVICAEPEKSGMPVELARCPYEDTDAEVILYRLDPTVLVLDPATGEVLGKHLLQGGNPGCPFSIPENAGDKKEYGPLPPVTALVGWVNDQNRQQIAVRDFGTEMLAMCQTPPTETLENFTLPEIPQLLLLDANHTTVHEWQPALPVEWQATTQESVNLVVCVPRLQNEEVTLTQVDTCSYLMTTVGRPSGGSQQIPLYLRSLNLTLIDPVTGKAVAMATLDGYFVNEAILGRCPNNVSVLDYGGLYSAWPPYPNFQQWFTQTFGVTAPPRS